MKEVVKTGICAGLVVVAITFSAILPSGVSGASIGKGTGSSLKIKSLDELSVVLNNLSTTQSATNRTYAYALTDESDDSHDEDETYINLTSLTTNIKTDMAVSGSSSDISSSISLSRSLQLAITEDAYYYNSVGVYVSNTSHAEDKSGYTLDFSMEMYQTENAVYINFHKFNAISNGVSYIFPTDVLNRWVEFNDNSSSEAMSVAESVRSVSLKNTDIFATMGKYIGQYNSDNYKKSGTSYSMKENFFLSFINELVGTNSLSEDDLGGSCEVSLSDYTAPQVNLFYNYNYEYSNSGYSNSGDYYYSSSGNSSGYEKADFVFSNINNTVINGVNTDGAMDSDEFMEILNENMEDLKWLK